MKFDGFIGASYVSPSVAWDAQRSINMYVEVDESGDGKSPKALVGTPGLALFDTFATSPVRGIWTGLADNLPGSTAVDLGYAVAGSKLYSFASNGTHTLIGDVGDDAAHSPVTFSVNGTQILISSAGVCWLYDGATLTLAIVYFNNGQGTLNSAGTAITWASGDTFDASLVGSGINIAGSIYIIGGYTDPTHITTLTSPGTLTGAAFRVLAGAGTVDALASGDVYYGAAGNTFEGIIVGSTIVIAGFRFPVTAVISNTHLTVSGAVVSRYGVDYQADRAVTAAMTAFLDGYFIALPPNSRLFYISDINNGHAWNPLDFGRKAAFPDNIASILVDHEELWLLGSETGEIWSNTGNADFPLQRNSGAFIEQGCRAPFTTVSLANGVAWIGGDTRGNPIAWRATGFQPIRVSTHGVETAWAGYSTVTDATAFAYTFRGHQFWVINFPTANATWVYDATAALWHERAWWNGSSNDRVRYATHGYVFGKHIVGDWSNGKLYDMSEAYYTDAGTAIHRIRTAPHMTDEELWTFYSRFRLSMQGALNPTLSWSDDQGIAGAGTGNWHAEVAAAGRKIDGTSQQSAWRRLGHARVRVWRVTITDAAQVALSAAYLDFERGNA